MSIDLERIVNVTGVKLAFPGSGVRRYRVEILDGGSGGWKVISDQTKAESTATTLTLPANSERGRFFESTSSARLTQNRRLGEDHDGNIGPAINVRCD